MKVKARKVAHDIESLEWRLLLTAALGYQDTYYLNPAGPAISASAQSVTHAQPSHLVINPIFDTSITQSANAAAIESAINWVISNFESEIATPITVTIKFKAITSGLGQSNKPLDEVTYTQYRAALIAHATSAEDKTAVADNLPAGPGNPVNGATTVLLTDPSARALGLPGGTPTNGLDGTIGLNISAFNLFRYNIDTSKYDIRASLSHEVDEVLALGSALNNLAQNAPSPTKYIFGEDLFRYNAFGGRSFNTGAFTSSYFSPNGGQTLWAQFNQTAGGDFSDWYSPGGQHPEVQDAFGTPGYTPNLGIELNCLDVLGYTLAAGVNGGELPDLTPFAPHNWSSPLTLTTVKGSTVDSPLTTDKTIYLDAAVVNNGEWFTQASYNTTIKLDGKTVFSFTDASGLTVNSYYYSIGLSLGKLAAGQHTLVITADTGNAIHEINKNNNSFTRVFTVTAPSAPDLEPYQPTGWSSPVVVATKTGATTDATTITTANTVYLDAAYINAGTAPVTVAFDTTFKVDGVLVYTLHDTTPPLDPNFYDYGTDLNIGKFAAGKHTLTMTIDSGNVVTESNKTNNIFTKTFTVVAVTAAPKIITDPKSADVPVGGKATFSASASGTPTPTVQWQISTNGGTSYTNITGATSTTYSFTVGSTTKNGSMYRAVFKNAFGTATTTGAKLAITAAQAAPKVTLQPKSQSVKAGATATFITAASGNPTPTVKWEISADGGNTWKAVATTLTYKFTATSAENGNLLRAVFTNVKGSATTINVELLVS